MNTGGSPRQAQAPNRRSMTPAKFAARGTRKLLSTRIAETSPRNQSPEKTPADKLPMIAVKDQRTAFPIPPLATISSITPATTPRAKYPKCSIAPVPSIPCNSSGHTSKSYGEGTIRTTSHVPTATFALSPLVSTARHPIADLAKRIPSAPASHPQRRAPSLAVPPTTINYHTYHVRGSVINFLPISNLSININLHFGNFFSTIGIAIIIAFATVALLLYWTWCHLAENYAPALIGLLLSIRAVRNVTLKAVTWPVKYVWSLWFR